MTYYQMFKNPAAAQEDDMDIIYDALTLARTLRDDIYNISTFSFQVSRMIRDVSKKINHAGARNEMWQFGGFLPGADRGEIDDLICDYLSVAQQMIETGHDA